ncbi:MAG: bifunctional pyr operon transcriptional regulator/uracil phosphoribosyltransferase [Omnitrophica bacterium RIFCSPLOWO2_12_FULL_50_11]|nr:MAG: bifunctional pyr operon transcriptional regulator/uracil phosphoribosyltransferase [Omnitrophica bacterium RIFCSPLOWO2_12_FULL_50_11]
MTHSREIINSEEMNRAMVRIAHEILEKNKGTEGLALIGIRTGGAYLAKRFQEKIHAVEGCEVPLGLLDITMYRDDLTEIGPQPNVGETDISFDVNGKNVVLVDDVLFTGRTIRCALDALIDLGRPRSIQLAVLVDRGHRELPVKPDYVGKNIPTARHEEVVVKFKEHDGEDSVCIVERSPDVEA